MSLRSAALVLVAVVCCATAHAAFVPPTQVSQQTFNEWMCAFDDTCLDAGRTSIPDLRIKLLQRLEKLFTDLPALEARFLASSGSASNAQAVQLIRKAQQHFAGRTPTLVELQALIHSAVTYNASYPYFAWMPTPMGRPRFGGASDKFATPCFGSVVATATRLNASFVQLALEMTQQQALFCSDAYLLIAGGLTISIQDFSYEQTATVVFNVTEAQSTAAGEWYLNTYGIHVLRFGDSLLESAGELIDTLILLAGFAESPLTAPTFSANLDFLNNYVHASPRMEPKNTIRTGGAKVGRGINPDDINTGDALLIIRPDGLDPMLGWAMGSDSGHTTIAMRFPPSNDLYICESTTKDAYWPTNGIQCHPWALWIELAETAQHNTVIVPLADKYKAMFNVTAAIEFFEQYKDIDYGYASMLFSWLDTVSDNFPCVPTDYKRCLFPQTAEVVAILIDAVLASSHQNMFRQALAHRTNLWPQDSPVLNTLMVAFTQQNMTLSDLYMMPELDSYRYNTTRNGTHVISKSMVCCVFVCNMWKAAGIYSEIDSDIHCGEQTNYDIYSINIFNQSKFGTGRPEICQTVDPANPLCQVTGNLTFVLVPDVNTRSLYKGMGNACPSKGPDYVRPAGC